MYLNKTPEVGDHITITDSDCLVVRKKMGKLCSGIVTEVTNFGPAPYLNFKSGPNRSGVAADAVKVLDPSQFPWRRPAAVDPMDQYYGA